MVDILVTDNGRVRRLTWTGEHGREFAVGIVRAGDATNVHVTTWEADGERHGRHTYYHTPLAYNATVTEVLEYVARMGK